MSAVSVIIPARNVADVIVSQLASLEPQLRDGDEIIVVDNGSTDSTAIVVQSWHARLPAVRVVRESTPGAAAARNRGAAEAQRPFLAFCDADDVVGRAWLDAARRGLQQFDAITGPIDVDSLNDPAFAASRGRSWATRLLDVGDGVHLLHAGNMAIRRAVFDEVGRFDETRRVGEDLELSHRLAAAGASVGFDEAFLLCYRYPTTLRSLARQGWAHGRSSAELANELTALRGALDPGSLLRRGAWLLSRLHYLLARRRRPEWVWVASRLAGQIRGSIAAKLARA